MPQPDSGLPYPAQPGGIGFGVSVPGRTFCTIVLPFYLVFKILEFVCHIILACLRSLISTNNFRIFIVPSVCDFHLLSGVSVPF